MRKFDEVTYFGDPLYFKKDLDGDYNFRQWQGTTMDPPFSHVDVEIEKQYFEERTFTTHWQTMKVFIMLCWQYIVF